MKKNFVLILCCIFLMCGCGNSDLEQKYNDICAEKEQCEDLLKEEKEKFDRLSDAYSKLNKENRSLKKDYDKIIDSDLYKTYTDIESANKYLADIQGEIQKLETDKQNLNNEIEELNTQKQSLKDKIANSKNEPISFYAGEYVCGKDFPEGRYLIYDGANNFFVTGGSTCVNIILGDDPSWGQVNEYVHFFENGELIEADSPFKLKLID